MLLLCYYRHLPVSQQNSTGVSGSPVKSWNLTRTTQFKDPGDVIISDPAVLKVRLANWFPGKKV